MIFDEFTVALLLPRPDAPEQDEDAEAATQDAHLAHLAELHEAGVLLAAGPLRGPADRGYRGLLIFGVDAEAATRFMVADPAVLAGWFSYVVLPWMTPAGAVAFSRTRYPRSIAEAQSG